MVQIALRELGNVTADKVTAFVAKRFGVRIAPKFIPLYRATLRDKERRAAARLAVPTPVPST